MFDLGKFSESEIFFVLVDNCVIFSYKFSGAGIGSSRRLVFVAILGKETSLGWSLIFILGIFVLNLRL